MNARRAIALLFILTALAVVATLIILTAPAADVHGAHNSLPPLAEPETPLAVPGGTTISGTLTTDATWGPGFITVTGDILINPGVVITIKAGTIVQVASTDSTNLGIDPERVEYMVRGTLQVGGPATFTSQGGTSAGGAWYGLRFLPGSTGWLAQTAIEHAVFGVVIEDASPTLTNNTIRYLRGSQGIQGITGLSGNPGKAGGEGMDGAPSYGISITGNSAPLIEHNTIHSVFGGSGGQGGNGGRGSGGSAAGADGGDGGAGGDGGKAAGIYVGRDARPQVLHNTIIAIFGGDGGLGGRGGIGQGGGDGLEPGSPGSPGGNGGQGDAGGAGGGAFGIYVQGPHASPAVTGNKISDLHAGSGGDGGDGGEGGQGGQGDDGNQATGSVPRAGGAGGLGQDGGGGGHGGPGGSAAGIHAAGTSITSPVQRNAISAIYAGDGGNGGHGGRGGDGGDGGNGGSDMFNPPASPGGSGGSGGAAGSGGHGNGGGNGGKAAGLFSSDAAHDTINNLVHSVTPGKAGAGGQGAQGGQGGGGGDAGLPWTLGANWEGWGGNGGHGGNAGHGGDGGNSAGWHASGASVEYLHNTSANIADGGTSGNPGSLVGNGGGAGRPGQGPGDPPPPVPVPGSPGQAGSAGQAGASIGLWAVNGAAVIAINNILAHSAPPGPNTYGIRVDRAGATLRHNNVWTHNIQYSGVTGSPTDIQQDPGFADWFRDDFFLHRGSPCIDAGMDAGVADDYDGQDRPLGSGPDIGFDEVAPAIGAKFVDLNTATPGAELTYTLIITNPDPHAPARHGILSDTLPAGTGYVRGPLCTLPACTYDPADRSIIWTGDLPAQTTLLVRYTALVDQDVPNRTVITNSAFYSAEGASHWTNVVSTTIEPVFGLTKGVEGKPPIGRGWPIVGAPLTYTIVITNAHPSKAATGVIVTDAVPAGGHWISGGSHSDGIVTFALPSIPPRAITSASWVLSTCQTSLTNERYRVATSTMQLGSDWGPPLTTIMSAPLLLASFAQGDYAPLEGSTVTFTDTSSSNGSSISAWGWGFGDGKGGSDTPITHTYATAGNYTVTLTITDACGYSETTHQANAVIVYAPVCTEVTGVELTVVTTNDIEIGNPVEFSADISPDDAAKLYRFRLTVDGRLGFVLASGQDPLTFSQRFDTRDRHTVKLAVWNCGQAESRAATALVEVLVPSTLYLHLPLVVKGSGD